MATYRKLQVFEKTIDFAVATKVVHVPLVEPKPDQVRVRQIYAGINALDKAITSGRLFTDGVTPYGHGLEALGIVDAIGSAVTTEKISIGQPVIILWTEKFQGFSEYSYVSPSSVVPIPELKPEYLACLINGLTASLSLDQSGQLKSGEKILITAAAGGTGQIAVQWAKKRGAYVIGLTSSDDKAMYLKELGADDVINYRKENLDQALKEKYPEGIDVIWETIGGDTFTTLFQHLAIHGRLVIVGSISGPGAVIDGQNHKLLWKSSSITGFMMNNHAKDFAEYQKMLIEGIHNESIKVQVDLGERSPGGKFVGLDQTYRAEEWLFGGKNIGKVVVQLQNV